MTLCEPLSQAIFLVKIRSWCASKQPWGPVSEDPCPGGCFESTSPWKFVISPTIHQGNHFLLSRTWIVHPHAGLSLSLPMSKFCLSLVFSSNGSAGHNCTIAATFHVFKGLWSTFTPPRACTYRFSPRCAFFSTISSPSVTRRMRGKNESLCPPRTWAAQWSSPT